MNKTYITEVNIQYIIKNISVTDKIITQKKMKQ